MMTLPWLQVSGVFGGSEVEFQAGRQLVCLSLTGFPGAQDWETTCPGFEEKGLRGFQVELVFDDKSGMSNCEGRPAAQQKIK